MYKLVLSSERVRIIHRIIGCEYLSRRARPPVAGERKTD